MNGDNHTVIIGAGAAGLMAAGAVKSGSVTVLEKNEKAGKKLYITGKGRCNVTNDCETEKMLEHIVTNPRFLFGAFSHFSPHDTVRFFEEAGIPLKTERGGRVFPASDKASDITSALKAYAERNGAVIRLNAEVRNVHRDETGTFCVTLADGTSITAQNLIVATGGKSYPATGSTGDGYRFAKLFGHMVSAPRPALVPILLTESVKELEGLSLKNVAVSAEANGKKFRDFGEMLFTLEGVSGPCVLSLSSYLSQIGVTAEGASLTIDLKPALTPEQLDDRILRDFAKYKNKQLKNAMGDLLPKRLIPYIIRHAGLSGETEIHSITKEERAKLAHALKEFRFRISALGAIEKGIVTGGGVDVREVNPKTMESKLIPRLYFAGEVLDVDALTGGFNIQIALSTGFLAGISVKEES